MPPAGAEPAATRVAQRSALCEQVLRKMPKTVTAQEGWGQVQGRMQQYISHTDHIQGKPFDDLLRVSAPKLPELLASFKVYSALDDQTQNQMVCQRQLWNIGNFDAPKAIENQACIGVSHSFAGRPVDASQNLPRPELQPGNQVAVSMKTPLMTASGKIREVVVLSCTAPALDSTDQPEFDIYVSPPTNAGDKTSPRLKQAAYKKAFDTIAGQVLQCAKDHPESKRVVLPAIGMNAFLSKLNAADKATAIEIGTQALADLVVTLRKEGKEVVFTDKDDPSAIMAIINGHLDKVKSERIVRAGKIPGDWIADNDLIVNAWDPHSLVGNKLAQDYSIDGFIGRNTLLHFMHGLHCAAHAENVSPVVGNKAG